MIAALVATLMDDLVIASVVEGRAYPYDIRRTGLDAHPEVFDGYGMIRPYLSVDDTGWTRPAFGHSASRLRQVQVWGFAPRTDPGRQALTTLMDRVGTVLYGWQDPATGTQVFPAFRLGEQADDQAVFARVDLIGGGVANLIRL